LDVPADWSADVWTVAGVTILPWHSTEWYSTDADFDTLVARSLDHRLSLLDLDDAYGYTRRDVLLLPGSRH
jgi:hypothetical protein